MMADHKPSRACYQHGCPSPACARANYQYMSRLRLEYHHGQRRRTGATQARVHTERLLALGWSQAQVARASRLAHRTIGSVLAGVPIISNRTAFAILSIPIGPAPADSRDIDATGTIRRIRALVAIGWPVAQLADQFGMYPTALGSVARGERTRVRTATAKTIALHYRVLCQIPGPSQRARNEARRKGWHGPLAWGDIDNPDCQPETGQPPSTTTSHRKVRADVGRVARLTRAGKSAAEIALQLGCHPRTVIRARGRIREVEVAA
jgi:lambda repressor-like predicted transcriptional regulator